MHSGFPKLRESMSFNLCFLPKPPQATPEAMAEAAEILGFWEEALAARVEPGDFLFGPFGAADCMYAPVVVRLTSFRVPAGRNLKAAEYMKAVLSHPPVKRWMDAARAMTPVESY
jgi:glutathione S-transferase